MRYHRGLQGHYRPTVGYGALNCWGNVKAHALNDIAPGGSNRQPDREAVLDSTAVEVPDIAAIAPYLQQLTFGAVAGFLVGYALKKVGKVVAIGIGILFVLIQVLAYYGFVSVNWVQVQERFDPLLEPASLNQAWKSLVSLLTYNVTFAAAFVPALVIGLKRG